MRIRTCPNKRTRQPGQAADMWPLCVPPTTSLGKGVRTVLGRASAPGLPKSPLSATRLKLRMPSRPVTLTASGCEHRSYTSN